MTQPGYRNLLEETNKMLSEYNLSGSDVRWVGTFNWRVSWETFAHYAKQVNYQREYVNRGVIDTELEIVGDNWWMERCVGMIDESWYMFSTPHKPDTELETFSVDDLLSPFATEGREWERATPTTPDEQVQREA